MITWNNRVMNRALAPVKTKQRYQHQLYEFIENYNHKLRKLEDFLEQEGKEG